MGFFHLIFPNLGYLERDTPLKGMLLELVIENKVFFFSKRALHAGLIPLHARVGI